MRGEVLKKQINMTEYDVKRLGLIKVLGFEPTYNEGSFQEKAIEIRDISYRHDYQL